MNDAPLLDAPHVDDLPLTAAVRIRQFVHRNAHNTTHQIRLEQELRELLAALGFREAKA